MLSKDLALMAEGVANEADVPGWARDMLAVLLDGCAAQARAMERRLWPAAPDALPEGVASLAAARMRRAADGRAGA